MSRSRWTWVTVSFTAQSTSSSVVNRPKPYRIDECACTPAAALAHQMAVAAAKRASGCGFADQVILDAEGAEDVGRLQRR